MTVIKKRVGFVKGLQVHKKDLKTGAEHHLTVGEVEVFVSIQRCDYCGKEIEHKQKACAHCGAPAR